MKSTAKATEKRSRTVVVLAIAVALMLLGSIFAQMFNTSFYKVKVSRISFDTDSGTLSGLLYMPKGVDASNPHPTIVTTHGYLNSAEMQDETAIEMSRRGYVVLALDMYDHGHSHGNADNTGGFFNFWPTSLWDAAQYMYSQDYVAKDAQGNGQIAVSGHSMGGFSSEMAIYLDEQNYAAAGYRIIKAGLSMGADYSWTSYLGLDEEAAVATFGGRTIGKICGQYDEFFFAADEPPTKSGTVYHKDYVATTAGKTLLEQEAPQADTWYTGSDGGQRIIYQPREIHPWNHFSTASTKDAIEFYATAFADQSGLVQNIASTSQIWYWKEVFELVALVGFLLMLAPLALLLMKLPFLSNAKQAVAAPTPAVGTLSGKLGTISLFVVGMLIPAIIFPAVYDGSLTAEPIRWMRYASDIALLLSVVGIVLAARSTEDDRKTWLSGSVCVLIASIVLRVLVTKNIFETNATWQGPTVNSIVTWALICACISIVTMVCVYLFGGRKQKGITLEQYGIAAKPVSVAAAFCVALLVSVIAYACLFAVDAIFKTDFRIWTFAFKTFEASAIPGRRSSICRSSLCTTLSAVPPPSPTPAAKSCRAAGLPAGCSDQHGRHPPLAGAAVRHPVPYRRCLLPGTGPWRHPAVCAGALAGHCILPGQVPVQKDRQRVRCGLPEYHPDDHDDRGQHRDLFPGISTTADWGCTLQCGPFVR